jgi:hypothetical protein
MSRETLDRIATWCESEDDLEIEETTLTVAGEPPLEMSLELGEEALTLLHLHAVTDPPHGFADDAVALLSRRSSIVTGEVVTGTDRTQARVRYPIYLDGLNRQSFLVAVREMVAAIEALDRLAASTAEPEAEDAATATDAAAGAPPPSEPAQPAEKAAEPARPAQPSTPWAPTHSVPATGMSAWAEPDPAQQPTATLAAGVQLRVDEQRGAWARVTGSNGWTGWVDARILQPAGASAPIAAASPSGAARTAGSNLQAQPVALLGGIAVIVSTFLAWGDWTFAKALDVSVAAVYPLSEWVSWDQPKIGILLLVAGALALLAALVPAVNPGLRIAAGLIAVVMGVGLLLSYVIVASVPIGDLFDHRLTGAFVAIAGGIVTMLPSRQN